MLLRAVVLAAALVGADSLRVTAPLWPAAAAMRTGAVVSMVQFNPVDAIKGTVQRLTDFRVARASHILVKGFDEATVDRLVSWKAEIGDDPEKFAEVAREFSQCPSRVKGGDLGFFTRGKMVKEFDSVVFNQEPGRVYGPGASPRGCYREGCYTG